RSLRKGEVFCDVDLMDIAFRDIGKYRKIPLMVEKKVEFDRSLCLTEGSPIKERSAEVDDGSIHAEEFVLEEKLPLSRGNGSTLLEKLIEHLLIELPRAFLVGVGQRGSTGGGFYAEMFQLPEAA